MGRHGPHRWRALSSAQGIVHASPRRHQAQPRYARLLHKVNQSGETKANRHYRRDAKAHCARKRFGQKRQNMGTKIALD